MAVSLNKTNNLTKLQEKLIFIKTNKKKQLRNIVRETRREGDYGEG